jgi:hypothetical protein
MEEMSQFELQYKYTWKCHSETLCIDILNKQKCLFSYEGHEAKTGPVWVLVPAREEFKERV